MRSEQLIQGAIDAYLKAGGPEDFVIMSRNDWSRNAKLAGVMTGQEWYEKFEKELDNLESKYHKWVGPLPPEVLETAKKAAGIEQ